ncbi:hypothetical protein FSP39_020943 [Pinctada imbricata]|uniref:AMP-binding enzyme C-terminal domain-containing protein n=1 Tax=Pinctada imbricata TaxID=66713 RepID=A0AA88YNM7_PINIB|nr:hypothetical protein FSP39_020943 [Pinctada imbricata]
MKPRQRWLWQDSGWFKTDDSARIEKNGNLIVDGRLSDTRVKIGTRLVSVSSMECKLKRHPAIADVVVFSYQDASHYHCVCCAIVRKPEHELSQPNLDEYMLDNEHHTESNILQKLELPRSYVFLDVFPRTYNGKIDRRKVAEICKERLLSNSNK